MTGKVHVVSTLQYVTRSFAHTSVAMLLHDLQHLDETLKIFKGTVRMSQMRHTVHYRMAMVVDHTCHVHTMLFYIRCCEHACVLLATYSYTA